jgi:hypothetical protein
LRTSLPGDAEGIGNRIVMALAEPFDLDGHRLRISASLGIARYPTDGGDATVLLKSADVAMYAGKRLGRNRFEFFHHQPDASPAAVSVPTSGGVLGASEGQYLIAIADCIAARCSARCIRRHRLLSHRAGR